MRRAPLSAARFQSTPCPPGDQDLMESSRTRPGISSWHGRYASGAPGYEIRARRFDPSGSAPGRRNRRQHVYERGPGSYPDVAHRQHRQFRGRVDERAGPRRRRLRCLRAAGTTTNGDPIGGDFSSTSRRRVPRLCPELRWPPPETSSSRGRARRISRTAESSPGASRRTAALSAASSSSIEPSSWSRASRTSHWIRRETRSSCGRATGRTATDPVSTASASILLEASRSGVQRQHRHHLLPGPASGRRVSEPGSLRRRIPEQQRGRSGNSEPGI